MTSGGFNWQTLGKADYSQAAAIVASLPSDVRSEIKGVSDEILRRLVHLMWFYALHSGRGKAYCWPSLAKLGEYCQRTVRTVQRHLVQLIDAGLLETKERYTTGGLNMSNLYLPGARLLASLFARGKRKSPITSPTTKMSCNDLKREYKADASPAAQPYVPPDWMLSRAKSIPSLDSSGSVSTPLVHREKVGNPVQTIEYVPANEWDIADAKDAENQRREQLRKQAELLRKRGL